ncbi:MAG: hypothetical protein HOK41_01885 [Nitrospina sp.]|jgi:TRAP-type C4-dicarboxylate transport system permease small subunit|nr:hypothetical protein [Nitrospina sp.]MBT6718172.1 hypothetical protein [Nitrospina sp.]
MAEDNNIPEKKENLTTAYLDKINEEIFLSFSQSVKEAQTLLHYAIIKKSEVDPKIIFTLVKAKTYLKGKKQNESFEADFLAAYNHIARLAHPVTGESLKETLGDLSPRANAKWYQWGMLKSAASRAVMMFGCFALLSITGLVLIQVIWATGLNERIQYKALLHQQSILLEKGQEIQLDSASKTSIETKKLEAKKLEIQNDYLRNEKKLTISIGSIIFWVDKYGRFFGPNYKAKEEQDFNDNLEKRIHYITVADSSIYNINYYLLPLLYGLLGANAHILRALSIEIKRLSFTSDLKIRYWLRLFLGMLAGIAIGWVSIPSDQILDGNLNTESLGIQSSISLPLAFLAGYSVELLFAAMDRIISAFSSQNQTKPK